MGEETEQELATLAGGCFWCLEPAFQELRGVLKVVPGYSGGPTLNPTYNEVCTGSTGHAEVVQVTFDPNRIRFREILEVFFSIHDPTTLNRQGADVGTQYRSAVFCHSTEQMRITRELISELERRGVWDRPVVTEVTPFQAFYAAEEYHHNYFARNTSQPYCQVVIAPKLAGFRQKFSERLRA